MSERWGSIEGMNLRYGADAHSIDYTADDDLTGALYRVSGGEFMGAEGGYVLLRFDVDGEPYSRVHVDPPAGWWPAIGKSPAEVVRRGADYLTALAEKLDQIEALG